ncbi:MAG TPA: DUF4390 domain-containing protein [Casimicrobiaceae bacterium]
MLALPRTPDPMSRRAPWTRWLAIALAVMAVAATLAARADTIGVRGAELHEEDGEVLLSADFDFNLNATLDEALSKGIALYIDLEFTLTRPRWYWVDEKVVDQVTTYRLSYAPLTRQYRIGSGLMSQSFATLDEVERFIGRVTSRPVARASALSKGTRYDAALRLKLDAGQLPKPLQVSALASREWQLSSEWLRWSFTP